MYDTTDQPAPGRRLTGCPWPTGIHRFVLGVCTRCGTDDLNPQASRGGFTDQDDQPITYVPTEAADQADAMVWSPPTEADVLADRIRDALQAVREAAYLNGRCMSPEASDEALARADHARHVADEATAAAWSAFYAAVAK